MTNKIFREKKHRLDPEFYIGERIVSFTLCINDGKDVFVQDEVFEIFKRILINELQKLDCEAMVYLFMPNHVHMIVAGKNDNSNVLKPVKMFKQKTGFWFPKNVVDIKWQKDFYDHIIRDNEDMKNQIIYILYNPVRKGLVKDWREYPYKGSMVYNLEEMMF